MTRFLILASLMVAPAAAQQGALFRATMDAPVLKNGTVKATATTWNCTGTVCTGPEINGRFGDARACREIVKAAGSVSTFATPRGAFGPDELARCNRSAKKPY